jgi:hypothetical protein
VALDPSPGPQNRHLASHHLVPTTSSPPTHTLTPPAHAFPFTSPPHHHLDPHLTPT